ncbi:hypothetical protein [Granulicella tundricola]|uniref:TrbL/VirB6 plasmid conjugal transfer protein n=1 Tax=Granulicella tundricola (strain ATCC BAA-1859 / DSM 23138 / MP5ACTX9) TaxID=1198114 RepID=E8X7G1_GRATM|nr:hypothetical protein [Granulicella tundricola]ADW71395.1 hypothetical protein AciX9_4449 [Granulicella tundricola MP5ACTX9]
MVHILTSSAAVLAFQAAPGVDWLTVFTQNLTNLTTQNGGALTSFGLTELSFISLMVLVNMVITWSTDTMTFGFHREPLRIGDLVQFLLRLICCLLAENYWSNPLPGASFGFNHLFSYIAQVLSQSIDQNSLTNLEALLKTLGDGTAAPAITAPLELLAYILIELMLGVVTMVVFLVNVSGFILYGVAALFGPVFIPLYMTKNFRGKFLHFVDVLVSFAMIRAVASAFIYVWAGFLQAFVLQTFQSDYSMKMWLANLIPCIALFGAFVINMLYIPSLTQIIFGGHAGAAEKVDAALAKVAALVALA